MALLSVKCPAAREGATPTTLTSQNENDIKGAPNGDHHDAKFDLRPKWPFWIGISGRFRRNAQELIMLTDALSLLLTPSGAEILAFQGDLIAFVVCTRSCFTAFSRAFAVAPCDNLRSPRLVINRTSFGATSQASGWDTQNTRVSAPDGVNRRDSLSQTSFLGLSSDGVYRRDSDGLFAFTGLWEHWTVREETTRTGALAELQPAEMIEICTSLTTAANGSWRPFTTACL